MQSRHRRSQQPAASMLPVGRVLLNKKHMASTLAAPLADRGCRRETQGEGVAVACHQCRRLRGRQHQGWATTLRTSGKAPCARGLGRQVLAQACWSSRRPPTPCKSTATGEIRECRQLATTIQDVPASTCCSRYQAGALSRRKGRRHHRRHAFNLICQEGH